MIKRMKKIYGDCIVSAKRKDKDFYIVMIQSIMLILICFLHSLSAGHYVDFFPINGTFQNYNPVRRFIFSGGGGIPYKDFVDYLGLGHLYSGALFTWIFGNNYQASLIAFTFLSFLSLALLAVLLGYCILKNKKKVLVLVNFLLLILLIQPLFYKNAIGMTEGIVHGLNYAQSPGHSARYIRGMILPLYGLLCISTDRLINKYQNKIPKFNKYSEQIELVIIAILSGSAFVWSNDYGISCWVCTIIMVFWITYSRKRNLLTAFGATVTDMAISCGSIFIIIQIVTGGNFHNWFSFTFGTGGYQSWYYNSDKAFYFYDVDFSYIMLIQAFLCLYYLGKLYQKKGESFSVRRYGIPAFVNMVCFCAVNEYRLLSGGVLNEVALAALFVTAFYEIILLGQDMIGKRSESLARSVLVVSFIVGGAWCVSTLKDEIEFYFLEEKAGEYEETLGGNMTILYDDIKKAEEFLNGERVFSTYASALEVVTDQYQPSGTDYIIHVLGDEQREEYLQNFKAGNFEYAATMKEDYTKYEYWIQRANWYWYRELYKEWHPVYTNSYELFWARNEEEHNISDSHVNIEIIDIGESRKKIIIRTDETVDGIADFFIDYEIRKESGIRSKLVFQTMLKVENVGTVYAEDPYYETNYLRNKSEEYIPVTIVDGYGEVILESCPESNTYLQLNQANCNNIYTVTYSYIEGKQVVAIDDKTAISISNSVKNLDILEDAVGIIIAGEEFGIVEIVNDEEYIYIIVDCKSFSIEQISDMLDKNNMLYVSKAK